MWPFAAMPYVKPNASTSSLIPKTNLATATKLCRFSAVDEVVRGAQRILCHRRSLHPPYTVLAVDDDPAILEMMILRMHHEGFVVHTATNGVEALRRIREAPPDLVITDWHMPLVDGVGLIENIRQDEALRDIPIILFTSDIGADVRQMAPVSNAVSVVAKTTSWVALRSIIHATSRTAK